MFINTIWRDNGMGVGRKISSGQDADKDSARKIKQALLHYSRPEGRQPTECGKYLAAEYGLLAGVAGIQPPLVQLPFKSGAHFGCLSRTRNVIDFPWIGQIVI